MDANLNQSQYETRRSWELLGDYYLNARLTDIELVKT